MRDNRRKNSKKWILPCCSVIFLLGVVAVIIVYLRFAPLIPGLLAGLFPTPVPPPTSGPAVYLLKAGDLPDGSRLIQYQEVPHPEGTDYAVSFTMPAGLQVYSKVARCATTSPGGLPDLSQYWPDTVRVAAPTVGQVSMTFHGPVTGKPSVTVIFTQGQCGGMIQVIGSDDAAATDLAINFARTMAARIPLTPFPTLSATQQAECYSILELSVSNIEFGPPATTYSPSDAILPMVSNHNPIDCGPAAVKLIDSDGKTVMEQSFNVANGPTFYGDYNAARSLAPGDYNMELWYGDNLLKTIHLTVR
jgi:hypothetical protein